MPGRTTARGYGHLHQQERKRWASKVAAGVVPCARCGELIRTGQAWDLGHRDGSRTVYAGPEHAACNRRTNTHRVEAHDPKPQPRTRW